MNSPAKKFLILIFFLINFFFFLEPIHAAESPQNSPFDSFLSGIMNLLSGVTSRFRTGLVDQNVPLNIKESFKPLSAGASGETNQITPGAKVQGDATNSLNESASFYTWGGSVQTPQLVPADLSQKDNNNPFTAFWNNITGLFNKAEDQAKNNFLAPALPLGVGNMPSGQAQVQSLKLRQQVETPLNLDNFAASPTPKIIPSPTPAVSL